MDKYVVKRPSSTPPSPPAKVKHADNNNVVTRLPASKIAELWEQVQQQKIAAPESSTTCMRLACFDGDGNKLRMAPVVAAPFNRYTYNGKDYVQIKTKTSTSDDRDSNERVQLQQLAIWHHPDITYREQVRHKLRPDAREGKKLEVSHLCHYKLCCVPEHMSLEESAYNKSRNYCIVWVQAPDGQWYCICQHEPRCVTSKKSKFAVLNAAAGLPEKPASLI